MTRPTLATIDTSALAHNANWLKSSANGAKLMAVVKADAYGHDVRIVAPALDGIADGFAVAHLDEAVELRGLKITKPILVLEGAFSESEYAEARSQNVTLALTDDWQARHYLSMPSQQRPAVWIKFDSGMHRLGLDARGVQELLRVQHRVEPTVFTHFADADIDRNKTLRQLHKLTHLTQGHRCTLSSANSPALMQYPETHLDWVRPGFALYGANPTNTHVDELKPVMTLNTRIHSLRWIDAGESVGYGGTWTADRRSLIATLPVGYADGYPRQANNGTPMRLRGQEVPLAGRVSMDLITADVTNVDNAQIGDEIELWGNEVRIERIAAFNGMSAYELLARIPKRLPRVRI